METHNENKETPVEEFKTFKFPKNSIIPARPKLDAESLSQPLNFYGQDTYQQTAAVPRTPNFLPSKPIHELQTVKSAQIDPIANAPTKPLRDDSESIFYRASTLDSETPQDTFSLPQTPKNTIYSTEKERRFSETVETYFDWLVRQATRPVQKKDEEEKILYTQEALHPTSFQKQQVMTFAPFRPELSALQTFTPRQLFVLALLGIAWLLGLYFFKITMITALVGGITTIYTVCLLINVILALRISNQKVEEQFDDELVKALEQAPWPKYTILCPLYKEAAIVPQFAKAMNDLDYPKSQLQILFLTEETDRETRQAIRALNLPAHFQIVVVPDGQPRTKPRACNYGLLKATGEYTVIFDAEDIPDPLQLKKAVLSFANNDIQTVCVQAKLNFYNSTQNLLTRWFTAEYSTWFSFVLPALQKADFALPLGGTSNHFRTSSLRALGGWDAYNVTEDCDLGLRLKRFNMKTVVLDSTTLEEANPNLKNWFRQRSRWIKGYMQTYLVHMRHPIKSIREGRAKDFFSFQAVIGSGIGVLFFNPLMWLLLVIYTIEGSKVIDLYHLLFPGPFLYAGAFCLIFGNFFYVYLYLLSCATREKHGLILWTVFIPVYWLLMSAAGLYAFAELLIKPHYWQKTIHGFGIKGSTKQQANVALLSDQTNVSIPALAVVKQSTPRLLRSITTSMKAISTLPMPAISLEQKRAEKKSNTTKVRDLSLLFVIISSSLISSFSLLFYFNKHDTLLYEDAYSHMRIARGVFDNLTPGLAQLGTVWLPLPHILMWPFIWNDYLWHSGLAGSFVSMFCYVISCVFVFLICRKITKNQLASFVCYLSFAINPNILYLQTTPLSELVCIGIFSLSCYFFILWIQEQKIRLLILTAICTLFCTLTRYDGWPLFIAIFVFVPIIGCLKKQRFSKIQSNTIIFGILGGIGIALWLVWNKLIFGTLFYFQSGPYSALSQQTVQLKAGDLFTYHNLYKSIQFYGLDSLQTVGCLVGILFLLSFFLFCFFHRKKPLLFIAFILLVPFVFYILALYNGNAILWIPGANPEGKGIYMFNVRYGSQMVLPAAIFIGFLFFKIRSFFKKSYLKMLFSFIFIILILSQNIFIQENGVLSLQDGEYNTSCRPARTITTYLYQHYNGGFILEDVYATGFDATEANIDFQNIIYEGSSTYWTKAIHDPSSIVNWIIISPQNKQDLLVKYIDVNSPVFLSEFSLVNKQTDGIYLYHRIKDTNTVNKSAPPVYSYPHVPCMNQKS